MSKPKKQQFTLSIAKLFLHRKICGYGWVRVPLIFVLVGSPFFPKALFLSFLRKPIRMKCFCPLYLHKRVYGFGQAPLFFLRKLVFWWSFLYFSWAPPYIFFWGYVKKGRLSNKTVRPPFYFVLFQKTNAPRTKNLKVTPKYRKKLYCCERKNKSGLKNSEPLSVKSKAVWTKSFIFRMGKNQCVGLEKHVYKAFQGRFAPKSIFWLRYF